MSETFSVSLREISAETVIAVVKLTVSPAQQSFVASNAVSLAQALFSTEAWYRAIYRDEEPVGFVMLYDEALRQPPPAQPKLVLWRLMIDHRYQGCGIGRRALELVFAHGRAKGFSCLQTSYVAGAVGPEGFYLAQGFTPTGELDEDEIVLRRPLDDAAPPR